MRKLLFLTAALLAVPTEALAETECVEINAGSFVCPSDDDSVLYAETETEITISVAGYEDADDLWECSYGYCVLDYGLVDGDDTVPLPSSGGMTCEDAPASCDGQDPPPKPPRKIWIKTKPRGDCSSDLTPPCV